MRRVVLITGHLFHSKRRAGFHFLAEALHKDGWDVTFFTAPISRLSRLRGDYRTALLESNPPNRLLPIADRFTSFIWYTPWHPASLRSRLLNALARPLLSRYSGFSLGDAEPGIRSADCFIFESSPALLLFDRFKQLNSTARFVYRVSDDIRFLGHPPLVIDCETRIAPQFNLISSPCEWIHRRFAYLPNARLDYHGIQKELFDRPCANPYPSGGEFNAVFVGNAHFDIDFAQRAARMYPHARFHVFGPFHASTDLRNLAYHGEQPFLETTAWVRHADIGLMNLTYRSGAEAFTDSLKVIQYTYCRLPIVAPDFLRCSRPNFFYYRPAEEASIHTALDRARAMDRTTISLREISSWDEVAKLLTN